MSSENMLTDLVVAEELGVIALGIALHDFQQLSGELEGRGLEIETPREGGQHAAEVDLMSSENMLTDLVVAEELGVIALGIALHDFQQLSGELEGRGLEIETPREGGQHAAEVDLMSSENMLTDLVIAEELGVIALGIALHDFQQLSGELEGRRLEIDASGGVGQHEAEVDVDDVP